MSLLVHDAHRALRSFCTEHAGIGVSRDLLLHLLRVHIRRSQIYLRALPSNHKFHQSGEHLDILFDVTLDDSNLSLDLELIDGRVIARVQGIAVKLIATMDDRPVCEIDIEFANLVGRLLVISKTLKFKLIEHDATEAAFRRLWDEPGSTLKSDFQTKFKFDNNAWKRLTLHFKAISLISTYDIAATFLEAIVLPDVFAVFHGIVFEDDHRLAVEDDLFMFSASSRLNFDACPVEPVAGAIHFEHSEIGQTGEHDDDFVASVTVQEDSPAKSYPSAGADNDWFFDDGLLDEGHVFLYTPIQLLRTNFDDVIKPAIRMVDKDSWGPFYYQWAVTAALKDQMDLSLDGGWPITFTIRAPLTVDGSAGAGIEIGSVRHEALGVELEGEVDPFDIEFRIMLDWPRREILFESITRQIQARNLQFTTSVLEFGSSLFQVGSLKSSFPHTR